MLFFILVLDFGLEHLNKQGRFIRCVLSSIVSVLQFLPVPVLQCSPGQRCDMVLALVTTACYLNLVSGLFLLGAVVS